LVKQRHEPSFAAVPTQESGNVQDLDILLGREERSVAWGRRNDVRIKTSCPLCGAVASWAKHFDQA
jgi:hypothetical protein